MRKPVPLSANGFRWTGKLQDIPDWALPLLPKFQIWNERLYFTLEDGTKLTVAPGDAIELTGLK